jgi:purine-cytosine permease-like protein
VSHVANIAVPWMVLVFLVCGIVSLQRLGVQSAGDFWNLLGEGGEPFPGQIKYTFWHVLFWSWFCNAAMHIGMADLSVFRYARSPAAGWTTAAGMYVGHYMAWICAALLYAVYLRAPEAREMLDNGQAPPVAPGPMTFDAVGIAGLLCVIVASWTTANPTIYRAGLAFQAIVPRSSRAAGTLIAGAVATIAGLFPAVAMQLLGFVATYGFILAPVGAIIVADHYFSRRLGLIPNYAEYRGIPFNLAVLLAWLLSMVVFYTISARQGIFLSFFTLPAWITCGALYLLISKWYQKNAAAI